MTGRMWAVDIEGSGKSPPEIVELAIVQLEEFRPTGFSKHWRFKPKNGISRIASQIHGISEEDLADAPDIEDVADDVLLWLDEAAIVGHNVRIELDLLHSVLEDWVPAAAYDTLKLARQLLPNQEKYGLEHLGQALSLDREAARLTGGSAHSAPFDATLSALLLAHLMEPLQSNDREAALASVNLLRGKQASLL